MQITEKTTKIAIIKSLINTKELLEDANILEQNERITRSYTLYHFALEEISKASKCILILLFKEFKNKLSINQLEKLFRNHEIKLEESSTINLWMLGYYIEKNPDLAKKILNDFEINFNNAKLFDKLKNYSLYTHYINNTFKNPSDLIKKEHLQNIKFQVETRFNILNTLWYVIQENYDEIMKINFSNEKFNIDEIKSFFDKIENK